MGYILGDLVDAIHSATTAGTMPLLFIVAASVLVGLFCSHVTHTFSHAFSALFVVGLAMLVYRAVEYGSDMGWNDFTIAQWQSFMALTIADIIGFWLLAAVLIFITFAIKSIVKR